MRGHPLAALIAAQVVAVAAVLGYAASGPLRPGDGLQQLDALTLRQRVPGVSAVAGRPTMYLLPGDLRRVECRRRLAAFRRRGLGPAYRVVVVGADRLGELAPDLALRSAAAADRCSAGYALVDRSGLVRYRTYDPGYATHTQEQEILLGALR